MPEMREIQPFLTPDTGGSTGVGRRRIQPPGFARGARDSKPADAAPTEAPKAGAINAITGEPVDATAGQPPQVPTGEVTSGPIDWTRIPLATDAADAQKVQPTGAAAGSGSGEEAKEPRQPTAEELAQAFIDKDDDEKQQTAAGTGQPAAGAQPDEDDEHSTVGQQQQSPAPAAPSGHPAATANPTPTGGAQPAQQATAGHGHGHTESHGDGHGHEKTPEEKLNDYLRQNAPAAAAVVTRHEQIYRGNDAATTTALNNEGKRELFLRMEHLGLVKPTDPRTPAFTLDTHAHPNVLNNIKAVATHNQRGVSVLEPIASFEPEPRVEVIIIGLPVNIQGEFEMDEPVAFMDVVNPKTSLQSEVAFNNVTAIQDSQIVAKGDKTFVAIEAIEVGKNAQLEVIAKEKGSIQIPSDDRIVISNQDGTIDVKNGQQTDSYTSEAYGVTHSELKANKKFGGLDKKELKVDDNKLNDTLNGKPLSELLTESKLPAAIAFAVAQQIITISEKLQHGRIATAEELTWNSKNRNVTPNLDPLRSHTGNVIVEVGNFLTKAITGMRIDASQLPEGALSELLDTITNDEIKEVIARCLKGGYQNAGEVHAKLEELLKSKQSTSIKQPEGAPQSEGEGLKIFGIRIPGFSGWGGKNRGATAAPAPAQQAPQGHPANLSAQGPEAQQPAAAPANGPATTTVIQIPAVPSEQLAQAAPQPITPTSAPTPAEANAATPPSGPETQANTPTVDVTALENTRLQIWQELQANEVEQKRVTKEVTNPEQRRIMQAIRDLFEDDALEFNIDLVRQRNPAYFPNEEAKRKAGERALSIAKDIIFKDHRFQKNLIDYSISQLPSAAKQKIQEYSDLVADYNDARTRFNENGLQLADTTRNGEALKNIEEQIVMDAVLRVIATNWQETEASALAAAFNIKITPNSPRRLIQTLQTRYEEIKSITKNKSPVPQSVSPELLQLMQQAEKIRL